MATNQVHDDRGLVTYDLAATDPATPASGAPVVVGQLPGVALTNEGADGITNIATNGVWLLPVTGPVTAGAILYYDAGVLSTTNTGIRFGYAFDALGSGSATIRVKVGY